jgi:pseudaminic acid synthase
MSLFLPGRVTVVAELSANHGGSLAKALELVDAAASAGAHAVKIQTWHKDLMVLAKGLVLERGPWAGRNLAELYDEAHTPWDWHGPIFERARARGMEPLTSVFDLESLMFLEAEHALPAYKVASFELIDLQLIRAIAKTGKPMILSTGMASRVEVQEAVQAAQVAGRGTDITVLRCTSAYPASAQHANLRTMQHMASSLGVRVGLSDHTQGTGVAIAAAALGARMIEKHLKLEAGSGLDDAFSCTPDTLAQICSAVQDAAAAPGEVSYGPTIGEAPQLELRRSLYLTKTVSQGDILSLWHFRTARPALGLHPRFLGRLIGRAALYGQPGGTPVTWGLVEPADAIQEASPSRV